MSFGMKLFFGICLVTMVWLVTRIIRRAAALAQWHRASHPQLKHYLSTLLLPLAFWIAPLFFLLPQIPSAEAQLITEQGTVTAYLHMPPQKCSLTADDGASPPPEWCTASAEMVHGGR